MRIGGNYPNTSARRFHFKYEQKESAGEAVCGAIQRPPRSPSIRHIL